MRIQLSIFVCFQLFLVGTLCQEINNARNRSSELIAEFNSRPMTIDNGWQDDLDWGRLNGLYYTDYTVGHISPKENSVSVKHVQYSTGYNCCNADCTYGQEQSRTETYERSNTWEVGTEIGTGDKSPIQFKVSGSYSQTVTKATAETTTHRFELSNTSPGIYIPYVEYFYVDTTTYTETWRSFWTDGKGERKPAGGQKFLANQGTCSGAVGTRDTWSKGSAFYCGKWYLGAEVTTWDKLYELDNKLRGKTTVNTIPLRASNGEIFKLFGWDKYECDKKMDGFEPQTYWITE